MLVSLLKPCADHHGRGVAHPWPHTLHGVSMVVLTTAVLVFAGIVTGLPKYLMG
jgi:hypothetical protein